MILGNKGINTYVVRKALGTSNTNIGGLCTHININKWSVRKPVRAHKAEMFEADFKAANFGFDVLSHNYPSQGIISYLNGNTWNYLKPRGSEVIPEENYRIGDFRLYDSDSEPWCNLGIPGNTFDYAYGEQIQIIYNKDNKGQDLKWILDNMAVFAPFVSDSANKALLYIGYVIFQNGNSYNGKSAYYSPVINYNDYLQGDSGTSIPLKIPEKGLPGSPAAGDYSILPVICYGRVGDEEGKWYNVSENDPSSAKGGKWFMLPSDKLNINISNISSNDPIAKGGFVLNILNFNYNPGERGNDASITFRPQLEINDKLSQTIEYVCVKFTGPIKIGSTPSETGPLKFYKSNGTEQMIEGKNLNAPQSGQLIHLVASPQDFTASNLEFADNTGEHLNFDVELIVKISNPTHIQYNGYLNISIPSDPNSYVSGVGVFQVRRDRGVLLKMLAV